MARIATFFYEGRLKENDEVFDEGVVESLTITFGKAHVMPPIEAALESMAIGEERIVEVPAQEGFGLREERMLQRALVRDIPGGERLPVGEYILWRNPISEKPLPAKVVSVHNGIVELDFNHPLSGKDLVYWIKLADRS